MMTKRLSPKAIQALKEAVASIYWTKRDFRGFLTHSITDTHILAHIDWTQTKKDIAATVVDQLAARPDQRDLHSLVDEVSMMTDFSHLDDDGAARARKAVQALRDITRTHEDASAEQQRRAARQQAAEQTARQREAEDAKRAALRGAFIGLMGAPDAQQRGYQLERLLNGLFTLAKLDPKASFRLIGEQIDGAFTFDGDDYLLEAKWEKHSLPPATLDVFDGKIRRKAAHTRGLLLAINGFQESAIMLHSGRASAMILMDGADLMAALEERIALPDLLRHKRRHAAHTGQVFISVRDILI